MNKQSLLLLLLISTSSIGHALSSSTLHETQSHIGQFKRISQVLASPNGHQIAYIVFQVQSNHPVKKWTYALYVKDQAGNMHVSKKNDKISTLTWSPDGKVIAYLANGKTFQSIWVEDVQTHLIKKLIETKADIDSFKWSPDGKAIAFTAEDNQKKAEDKPMPIDVSKDYHNTRLYLFSLDSNKPIEALTTEHESVSGFDWAPDSHTIAYVFQPRAGALYSNDNKIRTLHLIKHEIINIPYTKIHTGLQPTYSPDGKWIAFASNLEPSAYASKLNNDARLNNRICIVNTQSNKAHCLANTFNQNPGILGWNASSDQVFVMDTYKTQGYALYALNIDPAIPAKTVSTMDGFIEPLTITLNAGHHLFGFGYETVSKAPEVFVSRTEPFKLEPISHLQVSTQQDIGKTSVMHWKSTDGMEIEGLLVKPKSYDAHKKYPLFVAVHGGPSQAWAKRFLGGCDEYGEMIDPTSCLGQMLDLGFIVFQPNPRGSSGYGTAFALANFGDFGGGDYRDIMSGVDNLIQQGIADPNHLAVGGWSFGGYMTAWIISQTHRFKAAVEGDGNTDFVSFSGTSDIPNYYVEYLGSTFWDNDKLYLQRAPISYVKQITTPLLIIGGQNDVRVPTTQGYELYTALERQHKPVKMLVLPKQGHAPTDVNLITETIKEIAMWLKKAL